MSGKHLELGRKGEAEAASFLQKKGYKIIDCDCRSRFGQIDIIAKDKNTVCFIEVKSRSTLRFGVPSEAVDRTKQKKISRAALLYLLKNKLLESSARFDVVAIEYIDDEPRIELIKDAFPLDKSYT